MAGKITDQEIAAMSIADLLAWDEKHKRTPLHHFVWAGRFLKINSDVLQKIPMDETGWFMPSGAGQVPIHELASRGMLNLLPMTVLAQIPDGEKGWLFAPEDPNVPYSQRRTILDSAIGSLDGLEAIPLRALEAIPLHEPRGWCTVGPGNSTRFYHVVSGAKIERLPRSIIRQIPMDERGWFFEKQLSLTNETQSVVAVLAKRRGLLPSMLSNDIWMGRFLDLQKFWRAVPDKHKSDEIKQLYHKVMNDVRGQTMGQVKAGGRDER